MTTKIISKLAPKNDGSFPTHSDIHGEGGFQVRNDITDRDSIPALNRKEGMLVRVLSDGIIYTLSGGITNSNWITADFGGLTLGGDLSGTLTSQTVIGIDGLPITTPNSYVDGYSISVNVGANPFVDPRTLFVDGYNKIWVGDISAQTVSIINTSSGTLESTIDISTFSFGGVRRITGDSNYIYVCNPQNGSPYRQHVLVIDITTKTVVGICDVGSGYKARDIAADGIGNIWVSALGSPTKIVKFDISSVIAAYPTPTGPVTTGPVTGVSYHCLAIGGGFLWSGLNFDQKVYKLDLVTGAKLAENTGSTFDQIRDILYFNGYVWCTGLTNNLMKFDPSTLAETDIPIVGVVTPTPFLSEMHSTTSPHASLLIGATGDNEFYRVNASSDTLESTGTVPLINGNATTWINAVAMVGNKLYVTTRQQSVFTGFMSVFTADIGTETFLNTIEGSVTLNYSLPDAPYKIVADITARDAIDSSLRTIGDLVHVVSEDKFYTLIFGITNSDWSEIKVGATKFNGGNPENIATNRVTLSSPVDNTKNGIVNLSSRSTGATTGATGNYVTISGGDQQTASQDGATIGGGQLNTASGVLSGVFGGNNNTSSGSYSTIGGGNTNIASGIASAVFGGDTNTASGNGSFIGGGSTNQATTDQTVVVGGQNNIASGYRSFVGGGQQNTASGFESIIVGGLNNTNSADYSFIGFGDGNQATTASHITIVGGASNTGSGLYSFIGSGNTNQATGNYSTIVSGATNTASSTYTFIGGGSNNQATNDHSTVSGGEINIASGIFSTISGGSTNTASGDYTVISGGSANTVSGNYSVITGGNTNTAIGASAFIGSGSGNNASGDSSIIVGGGSNDATNTWSIIVGGSGNTSSGSYSFLGTGNINTATAQYSVTVGGANNVSSGDFSFVGTGNGNQATGLHSAVVAGESNLADGYRGFIGGGGSNQANGIYSVVGGGIVNIASSQYSSVLGGFTNTASGDFSASLGGQQNLASGKNSIALGYFSLANNDGQYAHNSASFGGSNKGEAQFTSVSLNGTSTNGSTVNVTGIFGNEFVLRASTTYLIRLSVAAVQSNGVGPAAFINHILVSVTSTPTATLVNNTSVYTQNTPGYGGIAVSVTGTTFRVAFTGIAGATVRAVATIQATEIGF